MSAPSPELAAALDWLGNLNRNSDDEGVANTALFLLATINDLRAENATLEVHLAESNTACEAHVERATVAESELAKVKLPKRLRDCRGFVETINGLCSCGGGDPENGCTACKIYHAVADWEVTGP